MNHPMMEGAYVPVETRPIERGDDRSPGYRSPQSRSPGMERGGAPQGYPGQHPGQHPGPHPGSLPGSQHSHNVTEPLKKTVGAKLGERLGWATRRFGGFWRFLFSVAAICVMISACCGVVGGIQLVVSPFDMINQVFLFVFGMILVVMDFPFENEMIFDVKVTIYKYLLFLTRFTGRGVWYLFLGSMVVAGLWGLDLNPFIGFFLGLYIAAIGFWAIFYGLKMSVKLEKVRKTIVQRGGADSQNFCPPNGLTLKAFDGLARNMGETFSPEELEYINAGLSSSVKVDSIISLREFTAWVQGGVVIL